MKYEIHYYWTSKNHHSSTVALPLEQVPALVEHLMRLHPDARIEIIPVVEVPQVFIDCLAAMGDDLK